MEEGFDLVKEIIDLRVDVAVLGGVLDDLFNKNPSLSKPSQAKIDQLRKDAIEALAKKYPQLGIVPAIK